MARPRKPSEARLPANFENLYLSVPSFADYNWSTYLKRYQRFTGKEIGEWIGTAFMSRDPTDIDPFLDDVITSPE
jgi:hypothetical protein